MNRLDFMRVTALKRTGWAFGSSAWGCDNPKDEDYLIKPGEWSRIVGNDIGPHEDGGGFQYDGADYVDASGDFRSFHLPKTASTPRYNFVVLKSDEEFELWRVASVLMSRIPAKFYQDKRKRIQLYEAFKELLGGDDWPELDTPTPCSGDDVPF